MNSEKLAEIVEKMRARAVEIKEANDGPNSYYHVAGDEPVDFVLDETIIEWADEIEAALPAPPPAFTKEHQHIVEQVMARGRRTFDLNQAEINALDALLRAAPSPTLSAREREFFEAAKAYAHFHTIGYKRGDFGPHNELWDNLEAAYRALDAAPEKREGE